MVLIWTCLRKSSRVVQLEPRLQTRTLSSSTQWCQRTSSRGKSATAFADLSESMPPDPLWSIVPGRASVDCTLPRNLTMPATIALFPGLLVWVLRIRFSAMCFSTAAGVESSNPWKQIKSLMEFAVRSALSPAQGRPQVARTIDGRLKKRRFWWNFESRAKGFCCLQYCVVCVFSNSSSTDRYFKLGQTRLFLGPILRHPLEVAYTSSKTVASGFGVNTPSFRSIQSGRKKWMVAWCCRNTSAVVHPTRSLK
mmetsp:Transcript_14617/g.39855  ORF Transcript_14617/g.39855 Transcript_14617/m.39855 type:complete len:252 (+) Transcript_14617:1410-2165(+)